MAQVEKKEQTAKQVALEALDNAEFNWNQVRTMLVAGTGFLTDSYDNFIIGLMVPMMAYGLGLKGGKFPGLWDASFIKAASAYGNLVGQISFGVLGDLIGRKKIYGVELIILIIGAVGCSLAAQPGYGLGFIPIIFIWRFILGFGVGGDYPVSSVITAEFATSKRRGTMMALVFSMQGIGTLLGTIVSIVTLSAYKQQITDNVQALDAVWRWMALFGIVPALMAVYYRLTIAESVRYTMEVENNAEQAAKDAIEFAKGEKYTGEVIPSAPKHNMKYFSDFYAYFSQWKHLKVLIGTSMTWFLVDVGFYGTNLNSKAVLEAIGYVNKNDNPFDSNWHAAIGQLIINCCGYVPGYFLCAALIDKIGRRPIQLIGFTVLTICFGVLAFSFDKAAVLAGQSNPTNLSTTSFIAIYCIAQFFFNFGPNTTTFIMPAEVFPTKFRSTAHGISAAMGKLGAIISLQFFQLIADHQNPFQASAADKPANVNFDICLWIFAGCCLLGIPFTLLVPETMGKTLEEIHEERED